VLTVAEVAEHAGFASVHYLSRVFLEATGRTPTAFRRQVRNPVGVAGTGRV
jgi:AraC-like DNA-binding protein